MIPQFFKFALASKNIRKVEFTSGIGCIYFFLFGNVNHMLILQEMIFPRERLK
jgi:hypothetical protein